MNRNGENNSGFDTDNRAAIVVIYVVLILAIIGNTLVIPTKFEN